MTRRYHGSQSWTSILTDDPNHPLPTEWLLELSRSFVGDLTTSVPRIGVLVFSKYCPWEGQLPIFEKFSIPVWVRFPQNASGGIDASAVDFTLCNYIPSQVAITHVTEPIQWGQPDDNM